MSDQNHEAPAIFVTEEDKQDFIKQASEISEEQERFNRLINETFALNESGKQLLAIWKDQVLMKPSIEANSTVFQAGLLEGNKNFVRQILSTIKKLGG